MQGAHLAPMSPAAAADAVAVGLSAFLADAVSFFDTLLMRLRARFADGSLRWSANAAWVNAYHNVLIYRGDLCRYRLPCGLADLAEARKYYTLAQMLLPASGKPHCQLAIVSHTLHDAVDVVYRYCRGLLSEEPAPIAKDNLLQVLEKYRLMHTSNEHAACVKVRCLLAAGCGASSAITSLPRALCDCRN